MKTLTKLLEKIIIGLVGSMTVIVILSVFLRYLFNISFVWMEELITFIFLGITYIGIPLGVYHNSHIEIDWFDSKVPPRYHPLLKGIRAILILILLAVVINSSLAWIAKIGNSESMGMRIPKKYIYSLMPVSFFLCMVYEINKFREGTKK